MHEACGGCGGGYLLQLALGGDGLERGELLSPVAEEYGEALRGVVFDVEW